MTISYAVTVWNELEEIKILLPFLLQHKRDEDEVVVRWDESGPKEVWEYIQSLNGLTSGKGPFRKDFARWKNNLNSQCNKDYIFQIDADELIEAYTMKLLPQVLETNNVELLAVPRINTVEGLTSEHIQRWKWNVNSDGWVNFPDYQTRIYKNDPRIRWHGEVHERIIGHITFATLPTDKEWCLFHPKGIERQERQNSYYDTI
jgi:hypothetical protein